MRRRDFASLLSGVATVSTVWPPPLSAQQKATPVIGYLGIGTSGTGARSATAVGSIAD